MSENEEKDNIERDKLLVKLMIHTYDEEVNVLNVSSKNIRLKQGYDLEMDYEQDILTLKRRVLDELPVGSFTVSYNKVFIQDLTSMEVGDRIDDETGLPEEGLSFECFI